MPRRVVAPVRRPSSLPKLVGSSSEEIQETFQKLAGTLQSFSPSHTYDTKRLFMLVVNMIRMSPALQDCTRWSMLAAMVQCAKLDLYPGTRGTCWLIPRRTGQKVNGEKLREVHFQLGYAGYLELARRSGEIAKIEARAVRENDVFEYAYGTAPFIRHIPARKDPGDLIASYAVGWIKDVSEPVIEVMEEWKITNLRLAGGGISDRDDDPWNRYPDEMWRKCAIPRICKFLPASEEMQRGATLDELSVTTSSRAAEMFSDKETLSAIGSEDAPIYEAQEQAEEDAVPAEVPEDTVDNQEGESQQ